MNDGPLTPLCDECSTKGEPFFCWLSGGNVGGADAPDYVRHYPSGTVPPTHQYVREQTRGRRLAFIMPRS